MIEPELSPATPRDWLKAGVAALGSLRLTVALLGLSIFLVFAGTLAQVEGGIWTVMDKYFRCWIAQVDVKAFFTKEATKEWTLRPWFPFPGGWLLGTALLINLVVSHAKRIRVTAQGNRRIIGAVILAAGAALTWYVIANVFDADTSAKTEKPFWRVTMQLLEGTGAALVLFAGCKILFGRKAGIVLLHSGVILMMLSELTTGLFAVEARMRMYEGQRLNFVEDMRHAELAVIDPSSPDEDDVVVVPQGRLQRSAVIRASDLPFDIEPLAGKYMVNAALDEGDHGETNPATAGAGLKIHAHALDEATGDRIDVPALYATLRDKATGKAMGTYLFSVELALNQQYEKVAVGDKTYRVGLRFKRIYKPYSIYLYDFRYEFYPGTTKPKDFSAIVRVDDPERGTSRDEVRIWMNNPLRYRTDTLYQSSWDGETGTYTELQVVENRGWMVPYVGCMIVAVGLLGQFSLHLLEFLRKRLSA